MTISAQLLNGTITDSQQILDGLTRDLFPQAITLMNEETLPFQFSLFSDDVIPTNQRNLTDVRTRMGVLLEYEFAKAINAILPDGVKNEVALTYVIANRFPDLAFRTLDGGIGVRFEVKAIQTIAEEKSANFDTLIKDIRKGTDFVVVFLWEWRQHETRNLRYPHIDAFYVMDAYQLAQMRNSYWLNTPPKELGTARQGFDLTFGVNARSSNFNKEEGNYGKLMRIFDSQFEQFLPAEMKSGNTLQTYYRFSKETIRLGLVRIANEIAQEFVQGRSGSHSLLSTEIPVHILATRDGQVLVIVGDDAMPRQASVVPLMQMHGAFQALLLNAKFDWRVRDQHWNEIARGNKPAGAKEWARR